jgi:hypothetical protein
MATPGGHDWDTFTDIIVNSMFFVALGVGQRQSALGNSAIALGLIAGFCLFLGSYCSILLEKRMLNARKAYSGAFGFDFDDLLYLMAPICWLNWLAPVLVGAAFGAGSMAILTGWRLRRLMVQQRNGPR